MKNTKTKKHIVTNKHGLDFEVELFFIAKDDNGHAINEWMFDEYNVAKCVLYQDRKQLLPLEQERQAIGQIMTANSDYFQERS